MPYHATRARHPLLPIFLPPSPLNDSVWYVTMGGLWWGTLHTMSSETGYDCVLLSSSHTVHIVGQNGTISPSPFTYLYSALESTLHVVPILSDCHVCSTNIVSLLSVRCGVLIGFAP